MDKNATLKLCDCLIGGLGAFIIGSNTVSGQLFGLFQWDISRILGLPTLVILGIQAAGGAGGNMICAHNIVAACSVTELANRESGISLSRSAVD